MFIAFDVCLLSDVINVFNGRFACPFSQGRLLGASKPKYRLMSACCKFTFMLLVAVKTKLGFWVARCKS